jgi:hypothetical protein
MLYILLIEREKKDGEGERNGQGAFVPRQTCPVGCAVPGFSWLLGTIKGCFKG